ncbi:MAG: hypothetical protein K1X95_06935 [Acidimicrobiia bacterium]|nr:hypothetical protein [Acidimicrobiia bacterium]
MTGWHNLESMFGAALDALLQRHLRSETDAAYTAYDSRPLGDADEWGDLESFRRAIGSG